MLGGEQIAALRVPGKALRVAVAVGEDRRAGERVIGGDAAVRCQAQDLAAERAQVGGERRLEGLAGGHVEHAVRPEGDAAAVVEKAARHAADDDPVEGGAVAIVDEPHDAVGHGVAVAVRQHGIDVRRPRKPGCRARLRRPPSPPATRLTMAPSSPLRRGWRRARHRACPAAPRHDQADAPGPLADQGPPPGRKTSDHGTSRPRTQGTAR